MNEVLEARMMEKMYLATHGALAKDETLCISNDVLIVKMDGVMCLTYSREELMYKYMLRVIIPMVEAQKSVNTEVREPVKSAKVRNKVREHVAKWLVKWRR